MEKMPKLFIDHPPLVEWHGDRFEITFESGGVEIPVVLTRHAAVGMFASLRRTILESERIDEVPVERMYRR
jgi:hypothetical protein